MNNHNLHLEFFDNHHAELPYLPLAADEPPLRHFDGSSQPLHHSDPLASSNKFYQEYRRIYSVSHHLHTEKQRLTQVLQELVDRIRAMESKLSQGESKPKEPKAEEVKIDLQS
jgi:hypothetical protein